MSIIPDEEPPYGLKTLDTIESIDADVWDQLCVQTGASYNPFISHAFLAALEKSNSVCENAGWVPRHLLLESQGQAVGAAPAYLKLHSRGEYIFDHHWADAYQRAGGQYYPKLLIAAPFTPATGPRFLGQNTSVRTALAQGACEVAKALRVSSLHVNFVHESDIICSADAPYLHRESAQYHWLNRGYESFDAFLAALSSRKRKAIRKERRQATESGLTIRQLRADEITQDIWDAFWVFYQDTGARKWGSPYLTRTFFSIIAETMADQLLMIVAENQGKPIAAALNFIGGDALYGRYWGCTEYHPFLHFEICYYQAIDFAIEHNLARVEAGAQGEHKIARGYEPVTTKSLHWIADPGFRVAIDNYLAAERSDNAAEIDYLADFAPFKKGNLVDPIREQSQSEKGDV